MSTIVKEVALIPHVTDMSLPKIVLNNDKFQIGRGLHNSQVVEDINISRSHCVFIHKDDCWYLLDKSSNGTWLNGMKLDKAKEYKLLHGDIIVLSENVKFEYQSSSDDNREKTEIDEKPLTQESVFNNIESVLDNVNTLKTGVHVEKLSSDVNLNVENTTNFCEMSSISQKTEAGPNDKSIAISTAKEKFTGLDYAEDELQCSICTEMFIKAVTLSCSHTFCKFCITQWRKNQTICPICRAVINMEFSTLVLDNFIEKVMENAGEELKQHRKNLIKERESAEGVASGPSTSHHEDGNRRRTPATNAIEISDSETSSEGEDDMEEVDNDFFSYSYSYSENEEEEDEEEDWYNYEYNGVAGHYYGGYGKCFTCGQRGHWSNGCPTKRRR